MIDYKLIGQRIKTARLKNRMTQEVMAEKLNVSTEYCSKIECGRVKINLQRLAQIANLLNEKIEYLITGTVIESDDYLRDDLSSILRSLSNDKVDAIFKIAKILSDIK